MPKRRDEHCNDGSELFERNSFVNVHGQPKLDAHVPIFHALSDRQNEIRSVRVNIVYRLEIILSCFEQLRTERTKNLYISFWKLKNGL